MLSESSAGWYWQFNRQKGYKYDDLIRTPNSKWITSIEEKSDWIKANDPCSLLLGIGWRLPTYDELKATDAADGWSNYNETFSSKLKLHAAGFLLTRDGLLNHRTLNGRYWSSSQSSNDSGWSLTSSNVVLSRVLQCTQGVRLFSDAASETDGLIILILTM